MPPTTYSISGTISSAANGSGATLTLSGASTATTTANSSGAYSFTGLANGSYTITASKSGFTFSPVQPAGHRERSQRHRRKLHRVGSVTDYLQHLGHHQHRGEWIRSYPDPRRRKPPPLPPQIVPVPTVLPASPMVPTQSRPARAGSPSVHPACRSP